MVPSIAHPPAPGSMHHAKCDAHHAVRVRRQTAVRSFRATIRPVPSFPVKMNPARATVKKHSAWACTAQQKPVTSTAFFLPIFLHPIKRAKRAPRREGLAHLGQNAGRDAVRRIHPVGHDVNGLVHLSRTPLAKRIERQCGGERSVEGNMVCCYRLQDTHARAVDGSERGAALGGRPAYPS